MTPDPARYLVAIAAALADRGIRTELSCLAGTPVLAASGPAAGPDAAIVTIHPDPGAAPELVLDCTCIWAPAPAPLRRLSRPPPRPSSPPPYAPPTRRPPLARPC